MLRDQPFMRDDTFLGVCQALGDGLRIPSNLLRLAIAPLMIWHPTMTVTIYVLAGALVALLHLIIPAPATAARGAEATLAPTDREESEETVVLAKAA